MFMIDGAKWLGWVIVGGVQMGSRTTLSQTMSANGRKFREPLFRRRGSPWRNRARRLR